MAPVVNQTPTGLQLPSMSAADKYESYVRSKANPSPQFDDNMKEPNNNNPQFKNTSIINNHSNLSGRKDPNNDAPQFFTCYTSYSCTPTEIPAVQSSQITESSQNSIQANQKNPQGGFKLNTSQLNSVESGKASPNAIFNNIKKSASYNSIPKSPTTPQLPQLKSVESFTPPGQKKYVDQINSLKMTEFSKPAPHAQLNNVNNTPRIPSPVIKVNDENPEELPRQRKTSNPGLVDRPQGQYGLTHSRSSPAIPSKGASPSKNESLVLQFFQNPQAQKNPQEKPAASQGQAQRNLLPPPSPGPAGRSKSASPRNSFSEKRSSVPNAKSDGDSKNNDWEKMLTKFYQW